MTCTSCRTNSVFQIPAIARQETVHQMCETISVDTEGVNFELIAIGAAVLAGLLLVL